MYLLTFFFYQIYIIINFFLKPQCINITDILLFSNIFVHRVLILLKKIYEVSDIKECL